MDQLEFEESNLKILDLSIAPPLEVDGKIVEAGSDTRVRIDAKSLCVRSRRQHTGPALVSPRGLFRPSIPRPPQSPCRGADPPP